MPSGSLCARPERKYAHRACNQLKGRPAKRGRPKPATTQTVAGEDLKDYSRGPESPLLLSLLEEPRLPPPPAAAFCCFSRASRMRALRVTRTLLPSIRRTF